MTSQPSKARPKASLWPRALAIYFTVFISFLIVFITWAVRQNMDLVQEDYYNQEMLFQKRLDTMNRTRAFARETAIQTDAASQAIMIQLPADHVRQGVTGEIHLYRPSDAMLDRKLKLRPDHAGTQRVDTTGLQPGLWKVRVQWGANGEEFYLDRSIVLGE